MLVAVALFAFQGGGSIPAAAQSSLLDGKTLVGEFGKKWGKAEGKDEIVFRDGKFYSIACDPYGFGDGLYTANAEDGIITFETGIESAKEGKIEWVGRVKGDTIQVTYTWYRAPKWYRFSKAPVEYWFRGKLKK
jgi:hypothetical protein